MSLKRQLIFFWCAAACMSMAAGMHDSVFNNFLSDVFKLSASQRGWLEFPRELPGFLAAAMTGVLCMLPLARLGAVGAVGLALGAVGMAFFSSSLSPMVLMMFVTSCGMHLHMPVASTLSIGLSEPGRRGWRMAQTGFIETAGAVSGAAMIWLFFGRSGEHYSAVFIAVACAAFVGGLFYMRLHVPSLHAPRSPLVLRRKFTLYYLLESVFGARKQVFLTFGPWVLIEVYGYPASSIAGLLAIAAVLSFGFKPLVGWAVDRLGERFVLVTDGVLLMGVCIGYGYAQHLTGDPHTASLIATGCYVADNLLFATGMGRAVYVSRISESPQETASTLAMGVSVNHVASMTIPIVAGAAWVHFGYERVFLAAAVLALLNALLSTRVPRHQPEEFLAERAK